MKNYSYSALLALLCLAPLSARADISINVLDAGELTSSPLTPMQADNSMGSLNGSLLLLFDLGSSNTASDVLTAGQFVSGTNTILGAGGFNTNGGTAETRTVFNFALTGSQKTGDEMALRWFPQITLAQYESGTKTLAGEVFGTYNPAGGNPDGGTAWTVPADGATIQDLFFFTSNSDGGGSQLPTAGLAATPVLGLSVAPEPSTYVLLGMGLLALLAIRRRVAAV